MLSIYKTFLHRFIKWAFPLFQKLGFHITLNNYYDPVPDTRKLTNDVWSRETQMKGVDLNVDMQLFVLETVCAKYKFEYDKFGLDTPIGDCPYFSNNGTFGEVDGDILYSLIRDRKPRKIIEIGSGWSTQLAAYALEKNRKETGDTSELTAIEPFPSPALKTGYPGLSRLIEKTVQEVELDIFTSLEENDFLFIDSTHIVKIDSDVCYEFLEILPRLKKGVLVHIHDIFLPLEYPKDWINRHHYFFNEAYLLQSFLMFNDSFDVLWAGSYMKLKYPEKMAEMFRTHASQSFWIRKVK